MLSHWFFIWKETSKQSQNYREVEVSIQRTLRQCLSNALCAFPKNRPTLLHPNLDCHISKRLAFYIGEWYLEARIWAVGVLIERGHLSLSLPFSLSLSLTTFMSRVLPVWSHRYTEIREFTWIPPVLSWCFQRVHFGVSFAGFSFHSDRKLDSSRSKRCPAATTAPSHVTSFPSVPLVLVWGGVVASPAQELLSGCVLGPRRFNLFLKL
jgi:hypothetical protein